MYPTLYPSARGSELYPSLLGGWDQGRSRWWQDGKGTSQSMWLNFVSSPTTARPLLTLSHSGSVTCSWAWETSSTCSHELHMSLTIGPPMLKSCTTIASTKTATSSKSRSVFSRPAYLSTTKPSTPAITASRLATSPTSYKTCVGNQTSPSAVQNNWGIMQRAAHGLLGRESQSDERVMSPPKHTDKLPS